VSQIELIGVSKRFGAVTAVDDVSFTAAAGKLLVLLGPSGCGKSTVLRLIAGLEEVSAGQVRIGGRDVTRLPPAQRAISMVFQSYALFPHLTVAENIVFGLRVRRVPAAQREQRLRRVGDLLGLSELLHRKPAQLSGGQRQRVALGRAIVAETAICLMDEPLSNLDAQLRHEMRTEIRLLQQRLGMTMVYVTHDQTEAMSMADQVILLVKGRIEQVGAPEDLYDRPGSTFAARFIGTPPMNLLEIGPDTPAGIPDSLAGAAPHSGRKRVLGVRPEHVRLTENGGVPVTIDTVEYLGADTIVGCRLGGQAIAARLEGRPRLAPGGAVRLTWATQQVHLFDRESGKRLEVP
jgi:sn-glycerol 3-phosphate transport system ATP-binding protein